MKEKKGRLFQHRRKSAARVRSRDRDEQGRAQRGSGRRAARRAWRRCRATRRRGGDRRREAREASRAKTSRVRVIGEMRIRARPWWQPVKVEGGRV